MKTTKVYITCDTPDVVALKEAAQLIALHKGCDPVRVPWPLQVPEESGEEMARYEDELWVCQKQYRQMIPNCDLFVAIVDEKYGKLRVLPPVTWQGSVGNRRISGMHFEILEALNTSGRAREIMVFLRKVRRVPEVEEMVSAIPEEFKTEFTADKEFKTIFSKRLSEYRQINLEKYLASLKRFKIVITCTDRPGLLASMAEVISSLEGNLAGGSQITKGNCAILQFVAEWPADSSPGQKKITLSLEKAFSHILARPSIQTDSMEGLEIEVDPIESGDAHFTLLLTFVITFVDQPGIAEQIFTRLKHESRSVLSTEIGTFLSGGMMLGRIHFSLVGDNFGRENQMALERELRKLPGILHVDSKAIRGRFWR